MGDIEIFECNSSGYSVAHCFNGWCVAIINYTERLKFADKIRLEKHLLTDEVFVLLKGSANLYIGEELKNVPMEKSKIYNIKRGVWHTIALSEDSCVAVVENEGTGPKNTEYFKDGYYNV